MHRFPFLIFVLVANCASVCAASFEDGACGPPRPGQAQSLAFCTPTKKNWERSFLHRIYGCQALCADGVWRKATCGGPDPCPQPQFHYTPPPVDPSIGQANDLNNRGLASLRAGDAERAIEFFSNALKTNPTDTYRKNLNDAYGELHFLRAQAAFRAKNYVLAIIEYEAALGFWPGDGAAIDNIRKARSNMAWDAAKLAWDNKLFDVAIAQYEIARGHWPNPRLDELLLRVRAAKFEHAGYLAMKGRRYQDAVSAYRSALAYRPDSTYAQSGLTAAREAVAGERNVISQLGGIIDRNNTALEELKRAAESAKRERETGKKNLSNPWDSSGVWIDGKSVKWQPPFLASSQETPAMKSAHVAYDAADKLVTEFEDKMKKTSDPNKRIDFMNKAQAQKNIRQKALDDYSKAVREAGVTVPNGQPGGGK